MLFNAHDSSWYRCKNATSENRFCFVADRLMGDGNLCLNGHLLKIGPRHSDTQDEPERTLAVHNQISEGIPTTNHRTAATSSHANRVLCNSKLRAANNRALPTTCNSYIAACCTASVQRGRRSTTLRRRESPSVQRESSPLRHADSAVLNRSRSIRDSSRSSVGTN